MAKIYLEAEHQELFHLQADLAAPIKVHIPSALGALGYFVCIRAEQKWAGKFQNTKIHLKVGGLRPDDVRLNFGDGLRTVAPQADSKVIGSRWFILAKAMVSRGDGVLTLTSLPEGLQRADVLLCTWPRFWESGQADDWIACQVDPQWAPNGVPLGGIGTGKVEMSRDGRFRNYSGNNNQDMPLEEPDGLPGAYLALSVDGNERALATRGIAGLEPVKKLTARLAFPQVELHATVDQVEASVLLSGPIVPQNLTLSCIPGFLVRWRLKNTGATAARVTCKLGWPNLVGTGGGIADAESRIGYADGWYDFWHGSEKGKTATRVDAAAFEGICFGNEPSAGKQSGDGRHYVAVRKGVGKAVLNTDAKFGSVACEVNIGAGAEVSVEMGVVWEMPHWVDVGRADRGQAWQNHFADGRAILERLLEHSGAILRDAGALEALFSETDLPLWMRDRLVNCCYPLVTNSVWYRDYRFSINEGPTEMSGCYGTLDQRLAAHPATQLLFPSLNAKELSEFAAIQADNGGVVHDLGQGGLERGPGENGWPDLTCSFVIQHARHAWSTGDKAFEDAAWPRVKKAIERHGIWAKEGGGVAQVGHGLGTSYDGYHYEGTTAYISTLWIAALQVARAWAKRRGETAYGESLSPLIDVAVARMEADLWNGKFYRAFGSPKGPRNENAHAGMLAGEYFSRMLTGEDVLPVERLKSCAKTLLSLNGSTKYAVPPDEVAPDGSLGSEYGWLPYVESFGCAPLAVLHEPGVLDVWRRIVEHMQQGGKTPCETRLMYQPVSGAQSWGSYYMTAPASWLVYEAYLDFFYRPDEGVLRLSPNLEGKFAVIHPMFWGIGERRGGGISVTIRRMFGKCAVKAIEVPKGSGVKGAKHAGAFGNYERFAIDNVALEPGSAVRWVVE